METKKIFKKQLAYDLRNMGCKIVSVEVNWTHPQFDVYVFEDDDTFEKAMAFLMKKD